jgi:long-chain acyl-CoA synthetase
MLTDLRALLEYIKDKYSKTAAFMYKDKPGGKYLPISYQQFYDDVHSLGSALMDRGFQGGRIGVIGENRYEWVVSYFAAANGLGIIVPLDKELPAQELAALIKRAELDAIIFSAKVSAKITEACAMLQEGSGDAKLPTLIDMDQTEHTEARISFKQLLTEGEALRAGGALAYDELPLDPDEMRILLFTSGTTGLAKGVMLSHRNICYNIQATAKYVNMDILSKKIGLSVLPIHHTYEFSADIVCALFQGCTIAFCEGLKYIAKNLAEAEASYILAVPLIFESMHKRVWKNAEKSGQKKKMETALKAVKALSHLGPLDRRLEKQRARLFKSVHEGLGGHLELLIAGAAAVDPEVVRDFNAMGFKMLQGYGMTECSPIIALNPSWAPKAAAAGLPLEGTELYIADPDENGIGEIVCRSDSVMLGYYKDPEETAKVLSDDGWLRTGDYGYLDKDGYVYITGRKKNVIVTKNGKNIFPEEVEYYLCQSPYIKECVVKGIDSSKDDDLLVQAEIFPDMAEITEKYGALDDEALRKLIDGEVDRINDLMSSYKRVKRVVLRDTEFEKTTTNKIKRW